MESTTNSVSLSSTQGELYVHGTKDDPRDSRGLPKNIASYQPQGLERQKLIEMGYDVETGNTNLNISYLELDNRTLQMAFYDFYRSFIGFTQTHASNDPDSSWQSYLHKPYIMNKSQVMIAHAASTLAYPYFFARDDQNDVAHLESHVIQALSDIVFDDTEFVDKMIRSITASCYMPYVVVKKYYDGKRHKLKLCDMTTFKFANFYEGDIQNQRFVIEDELIDFWEADALYKNQENWKYVKPGADIYFDANSQMFLYRQDGLAIRNLVRRRTYFNKALDMQLVTVNGVLVCPANQRITRIGKQHDRPYPYATLIFESFGRETIAGRTLAQKLWSEERLASMLNSILYDMSRQAVAPTLVAYGSENLTAKVFAPGTVVNAGNNDNFKVEPIIPPSQQNLKAAFDMLNYLDGMASEASNSDALRGGQAQPGVPARNAVIAAQNAEIVQLGTFVKNMEKFVRDIGLLTMDDIFQHTLAKDIDKATNKISWKASLLLQSKDKNNTTMIRLANNDFPDDMSRIAAEVALADEANRKGYKTIYQINPELYKDRIFYDCQVSVQQSAQKNKEIQKALAMEYHTFMMTNPTYDVYQGSRKVTEFYYPENVDDLVKKPQMPIMGQPAAPTQQSGATNTAGRQVVNNGVNQALVPGA